MVTTYLPYDVGTGLLEDTNIRIWDPELLGIEGDRWSAMVSVSTIPSGYSYYRVAGHGTGYGNPRYKEECIKYGTACHLVGEWGIGEERKTLWGWIFDIYLVHPAGEDYIGSFSYEQVVTGQPSPFPEPAWPEYPFAKPNISIELPKHEFSVGETITVTGSLKTAIPNIPVTLVIDGVRNPNLATETDSYGSYSIKWIPGDEGSYKIKARAILE